MSDSKALELLNKYFHRSDEFSAESFSAFKFMVKQIKTLGLTLRDFRIVLRTDDGSNGISEADKSFISETLELLATENQNLKESFDLLTQENKQLKSYIKILEMEYNNSMRKKNPLNSLSATDRDYILNRLPSIDLCETVPVRIIPILNYGTFTQLERTVTPRHYMLLSDRMPQYEFDAYIRPFLDLLPDKWFIILRECLMKIKHKRLNCFLNTQPDEYGEVILSRGAVLALRIGIIHSKLMDQKFPETSN